MADSTVREHFQPFLTEALRDLLSRRHLYQSVRVDIDPTIAFVQSSAPIGMREAIIASFRDSANGAWEVNDPAGSRFFPGRHPDDYVPPIQLNAPDVKLYCPVCERKEPFGVCSAESFLGRSRRIDESPTANDKCTQVFVLSYRCQSCKSVPEVFLIRRHGLKLTLCGRAPIETVETPPCLPKNTSRFFSDATVAYNSGQVLAGLFLLRTFIEQWTSRIINRSDLKADEMLDAYMADLPGDFKARFPSLRELYGELSVAIHSATASDELFNNSTQDIIRHFEARRLFALDPTG